MSFKLLPCSLDMFVEVYVVLCLCVCYDVSSYVGIADVIA